MKFSESEALELKTSTAELDEAVISISAILNKHQKGELYFGIRNNGEIVGQEVSDKTLRDISKSISDHIEPRIYPKIKIIMFEGKQCVSVEFEGLDVPYFAFGRGYVRVGTENKQMTAQELKHFILRRNKIFWDGQASEKTLKDVNTNILKSYVERANKAKRITFTYVDAETTLHKLNLFKEGRLAKAAEVLFCDNNSLIVQAAVFAGIDKVTFIDIQQFKGTIFELLEKSETYIKEHMNWRADLSGRQREEIPEVPVRAIAEALVNSLCHRDYANPKGNEVAIFKDRIEIYNPGQFPEDYTPEDFIRGREKSILRNPLIANTLFLSKDIEQWGSGLKRIYGACKQSDVNVEFSRLKSGFSVIFYRKEDTRQKSSEVAEKNDQKSDQKSDQKIIQLISQNPKITIEELMQRLGFSESGIKKVIKQLKESGRLKRVGPDKGGHWEIVSGEKVGEDENE